MREPTPSRNERLPFRVEGFATLPEGLDYAARGETGFNFHGGRGALERVLPYAELADAAKALAPRLFAAAGRERGERVALLAETSADFVIAFFACQYAGLVPVPLPLPMGIGGGDAWVERLRALIRAADARLVLGPREFLPLLRVAAATTAAREVLEAGELADVAPAPGARPFGPGEPCYIQYSSGSTGRPKGVLVTQRALVANALAIARDGLALRPGDRCVSWLPLYHDMGLVGCCLTPVMAQIPVDYLPTAAFARRPLLWIELLHRYRATISYAPTFGYELAARRAAGREGLERFDLSAWRVAGIGGEMIRASVLRRFAETFRPAGFDPRAFLPSYGLAEATLAVSFAPPGWGLRTDLVRRDAALECFGIAAPASRAEAAAVREFVSCGRPLPGYAVEIRDEHGRPLPERRVGRVFVKGPSVMQGYFGDPEATDRVLDSSGWLDTGDLGYLAGGELVITGRSKDLIIIAGRNIWPQDLEWAVERLPGVRAGDVAAFSVDDGEGGTERVVVAVECRLTAPRERARLRRDVKGVVARTAGVDCEVVLVPPRTLPYTTSGKLSRATAREMWRRGELADIDGAEAALLPAADPARRVVETV